MIHLSHIRPAPIYSDGKSLQSDIWDRNLTFEANKKYLVTAPSGKGKSTFLHILYGLRKDYTGQYTMSPSYPTAKERQQQLSVVFQDLRLFSELSALENLTIKNKLTNWKSKETLAIWLKEAGLEPHAHKPSSQLSYGQQQRVAILRSLCQPMSWLLLDEPFSHLDQQNIAIMRTRILSELKAQNAGLILVSLGDNYGIDFDYYLEL